MKKEVTPTPLTLDSTQVVEDGLGSGDELHGKKMKKRRKFTTMLPASEPSQAIEDCEPATGSVKSGLGNDAESHGKKKKKKRKFTTMLPASDPSQSIEDCGPATGSVENGLRSGAESHGKKKKKRRKFSTTLPALDPSQSIEDCRPATGSVENGLRSGAESHGKKKEKKRKFTTTLLASDPSQSIEDCGPVKKTILKSQKRQADTGAESDRKKKKVSFQLPDRAEDEPSEINFLGEGTEITDLESLTWKTDRLRPGLVYGMYTAEEDKILKQAIFGYIQEQGWDREEGLEKILNSRKCEARGCWHVIRKCLPQREIKRIHGRAHRILGPNTLLGKWTSEEMQSLTELHSVYGKDWKRIGTVIGRDPQACMDKWRYLKYTLLKDFKTGAWSAEEQQKLCKLVLKCVHVKKQMAKKGLITTDHRLIRDDINWEFIAEQMDGRGRLDCLAQWYRRLASPMVTTGEWSNGDDQRLLERLMEEFPLSEELVEWDSLLDNRSGETCKRRWEQMQRTLGRGPEVRHQHFLEKLESIMKRFAPYLLDAEYDQKFAEDMLRADADEPEDE